VTLGLYPSLADHPIEKLRQAGVPVSINTDDPALLGQRLEAEYGRCADAFRWSDAVLRDLARNSVEASFATPEVKRDIMAKIETWRMV
jgi:adenosine deaminase